MPALPASNGVSAVAGTSGIDPLMQRLIEAVARSARESSPAIDQFVSGPVRSIPVGTIPASEEAVRVHRSAPAWPAPTNTIAALIESNSVGYLDDEALCLATAVYFESKGEPLEGQLAVAQVILNRAASGLYPTNLCAVVKQPAQFSFVRKGEFPRIETGCKAWRHAQAIARIAKNRLLDSVPLDVLWYHADYVSPRWREGLIRVEKIGAHIFYRA
jgi:spore germination cell wall hydrolase CwlJ-like protein